MNTIVLDEPGRFSLREDSLPERAEPGFALVRTRRVGICGTDLHAFEGTQTFFQYPRVLGHELGVEVLEVEDNDSGIAAGARCSVEPYLNCGECIACRRGKGNCCENLNVMGVHVDGGMRERFLVPVNKLHRSDSLSFEQLALVETLGIGAHAVFRSNLQAGENVLVVGCGPIGLSVLTFVRGAGANAAVMDIDPGRLEFGQNRMGAEFAVDARCEPIPQLKEHFGGELPTLVFDCTGNAASMERSFGCVASGGSLVFVGIVKQDLTFHDPEFHRREITLYASRNSLPADFKRIIALMEEGRIDIGPWINERVGRSGMAGRFPEWTRPESGVIKAMVEW